MGCGCGIRWGERRGGGVLGVMRGLGGLTVMIGFGHVGMGAGGDGLEDVGHFLGAAGLERTAE